MILNVRSLNYRPCQAIAHKEILFCLRCYGIYHRIDIYHTAPPLCMLSAASCTPSRQRCDHATFKTSTFHHTYTQPSRPEPLTTNKLPPSLVNPPKSLACNPQKSHNNPPPPTAPNPYDHHHYSNQKPQPPHLERSEGVQEATEYDGADLRSFEQVGVAAAGGVCPDGGG